MRLTHLKHIISINPIENNNPSKNFNLGRNLNFLERDGEMHDLIRKIFNQKIKEGFTSIRLRNLKTKYAYLKQETR